VVRYQGTADYGWMFLMWLHVFSMVTVT